MKDKVVYMIWVRDYGFQVLSQTSFLGVYEHKDLAEKVVESLNRSNSDPIESDEYGPLRGKEYFVSEETIR